MFLTREEYLAQQQASNQNAAGRVSFFTLKDDGAEAIVRFAYSDPSQFEILTVHRIVIDGNSRAVNCLRSLRDPMDKCPLCAAGQKEQQKFYIRLLEYVKDEATGQITAVPRIWERSASYVKELSSLFAEYGDISNCVFKIKRSGARGSMQTTYSILYANPVTYNVKDYPMDFSAFDSYNVLGQAVLDMSYADMTKYISGAGGEVTSSTYAPKAVESSIAGVATQTNSVTAKPASSAAPKRVVY